MHAVYFLSRYARARRAFWLENALVLLILSTLMHNIMLIHESHELAHELAVLPSGAMPSRPPRDARISVASLGVDANI